MDFRVFEDVREISTRFIRSLLKSFTLPDLNFLFVFHTRVFSDERARFRLLYREDPLRGVLQPCTCAQHIAFHQLVSGSVQLKQLLHLCIAQTGHERS